MRAGGGLRAGNLDDRITVQSRGDTRDSTGEPIPAWDTDVATFWGAATAVSGQERFEAMGLDATITWTIEARWVAGIEAEMRAVVTFRQGGTRTLSIESVQPVGAADMLLLCTELAD